MREMRAMSGRAAVFSTQQLKDGGKFYSWRVSSDLISLHDNNVERYTLK